MEPGALKQKHSTEKDFSAQRKNFLYLPKNDKFFKRKKNFTPTQNSWFSIKKFFLYLRKTNQREKKSYIFPRKQIFQTNNLFLITGKNKFSKQKFSYTCLTK